MKEENNIFVVKFLLKTEKYQEDFLDKRFHLLSQIYDDFQRKMIRIHHYISQTNAYKEAQKKSKKDFKTFVSNYEIPFTNNKGKAITIKPLTAYGMNSFISKFNERYKKHNINSSILEDMASNAWSAWDKFLFNNGKKIHLKRGKDAINSYSIRIKGGSFNGIDTTHLLDKNIIGIKKDGKKITYIPFKVNRNSLYELYALENPIRCISIQREMIRGKYKYYVVFTFEGVPYNKNRELGNGRVGIDIGPSTIAISSANGVNLDELAADVNKIDNELRVLQRKIDRSRRATNPERFNEDGTYNRSSRGEWILSNHYKKTASKIKELQRRKKVKTRLSHINKANEVLTMGNEFVVEKNSFAGMQRRTKETTVNKKGKYNSKKRFGRSILNHAPATFVEILKNKVRFMGGELYKVDCCNSASQFDFTNGEFTKHELKERKIALSNGNIHQRDMMAAFNLQHLVNVEGKGEKKAEHYDVNKMIEDYPKFKIYEIKEMDRIKKTQKKRISTFGF